MQSGAHVALCIPSMLTMAQSNTVAKSTVENYTYLLNTSMLTVQLHQTNRHFEYEKGFQSESI